MAPVSPIQYQPHQLQPDKPKRQFTKLNVSLPQALQQLMRLNLVTLKDPPKNPNRTPSRYNPNAHCAYHSDSPGHATEDCWTLKNKIQDLIEEGAVEFTRDGQAECFYHPYRRHQLKWQAPRLENFCSFECSSCIFLWLFKHLFMSNIVISLMHYTCLFWSNCVYYA